LFNPTGHDGHLVSCESSGLVRTNLIASSHDFSGIGLTNESVVGVLEIGDGELKRNCDSQGESFGYSHDNNSHSNDESLGDVSEVLFIREVALSEGPDVEHNSEHKSEEHKSSRNNTNLTDPLDNSVEFVL
jgi:hypothetical protein